ncbi:aspartic peptidase domain-containing protein, partial [Roridomyces roridus]
FQDTGIPVSNGYSGGFVNGTIGLATVQLGPYSVAQQAFNNAKSVTLALVLDLGLDGLIGMSFAGQGDISSIGDTLQGNPNFPEDAGRAFILNVVDQTPTQNSFIAFSLSRTDDQEGTSDASFTINDVDPKYAAVQNAPILPLFPGNIGEWGFIFGGFTVDGKPVKLPPSNVDGVPPGQMVLRLDTGTPFTFMPQALIDGIYSLIPGAQNQQMHFFGPNKVWTVPCNTTAILSLQIGGQEFPIHPLDLSEVVVDPSTNLPLCVTPFATFTQAFGMDIFAGDSFMRNFYSVFNFGVENPQSVADAPSVQLLAQTNAQSASQDAVKVRASLLAQIAP